MVVIGSGAAGLPAAIAASERGASVIVVEANFDVGGHAIVSGGNVALGGGTSAQKKYGIVDSPDLVFSDLTDWSVVEPNGFPDYRYNDKEIIRAFADNSAPTYEFLVAHGVIFVEKAPDNQGAGAGRQLRAAGRPCRADGVAADADREARRRDHRAHRLVGHRPDQAARGERAQARRGNPPQAPDDGPRPGTQNSGRVLGIAVMSDGRTLNIRARKGVVITTGGSTGNVSFRRMFDPRLTEEYCGVAGEPYTVQDASGELAAMAIGASLWGGFNQTGEFGQIITKPGRVGCQYGYVNLTWEPTSPIFHLARAVGLTVRDYQDVILVNKAGTRFYDETKGQFSANNYNAIKNYVPHSWRNAANMKYNPADYLNAALAGTGDAVNGGGPIWAIFDSQALGRENWTRRRPLWTSPRASSSAATRSRSSRPTSRTSSSVSRCPPASWPKTVARYNSFVDSGETWTSASPRPSTRSRRRRSTPPGRRR